MPTAILVAAEGPAWAVRCPALCDNPQFYGSGARAEASARALAERLNQAGVDCLLEVRLRNGDLAGRFVCPATARPAPALLRAA